MPLEEVPLDLDSLPLPANVESFLKTADEVVSEHMHIVPGTMQGFVPSDFVTVYRALHEIVDADLATGTQFCEWGSGVGTVTLLAAMLGCEACGIEIDHDLTSAAQRLAADFEVEADLITGSFVPPGTEHLIDDAFVEYDGELNLEPHADSTYDQLGKDVQEFDVIFAFPWPNDEQLTGKMFDFAAAEGALLLTYHEMESVKLQRKI